MVKYIEKNVHQNLIFRYAGTVLCGVHMQRACCYSQLFPGQEKAEKRKEKETEHIPE